MKKNDPQFDKMLRITCYFLSSGLLLGMLMFFTRYGAQAGNGSTASSRGSSSPLSVGPLVSLGGSPSSAKVSSLNTIYLPLLVRSGAAGSPTPTPVPTAPPPPQGLGSSFFFPYHINNDAVATDGPSISLDKSNGVHVAYSAYTSDSSGKRPAYYTYCASNCTNPAQFSAPVALGYKVDHINLSLDPTGHPRMLWIGPGAIGDPLNAFYYAECNVSCTAASNWAVITVVKMDTTLAHSSRFFGVDPQGQPGFVYYNDDQYHKTTYYRYCKASCTNAANWLEVSLMDAFPQSNRELRGPSLDFSSTGLPRIAAAYTDYTATNPPTYLIYIECSADCTTMSIGGVFDLRYCDLCDDTGGYFNLRMDKNDHPRLALFTGGIQNAAPILESNRLYYLYCNTNCGDPNLAVWNGYYIILSLGVGQGVDLGLDGSGRPRLTFEDASQGLLYAFCTGACDSGAATWQVMLADSSAALDLTEPVPSIPPCVVEGWFTGKRTSLALDSAGNPRVASDAEHWQGLNPVTNPPGSPGCPGFRMDQINARFTIFNQP